MLSRALARLVDQAFQLRPAFLLTIEDGKITAIDLVVDPESLAELNVAIG